VSLSLLAKNPSSLLPSRSSLSSVALHSHLFLSCEAPFFANKLMYSRTSPLFCGLIPLLLYQSTSERRPLPPWLGPVIVFLFFGLPFLFFDFHRYLRLSSEPQTCLCPPVFLEAVLPVSLDFCGMRLYQAIRLLRTPWIAQNTFFPPVADVPHIP